MEGTGVATTVEIIEKLFLHVASVSLMASVIVVLVLLCQWLFGDRLNRRWHYLLWLLVLARLLLPWTPESPVSLYAWLLPDSGSAWHVTTAPSTAVPPPVAAPAESSASEPDQETSGPGEQLAAAGTGGVAKSKEATSFILPLVALIWLAGVFAAGCRLVIGHIRFHRRLRKANPVADPRLLQLLEGCRSRMNMRASVTLWQTEAVAAPALYGVWRLRLLLPASSVSRYTEEELRIIFLHELAHGKRHDTAVNWCMSIALVLHWFNPLLWMASHRMREDQEIACDALALSRMAGQDPQAYGRSMIRLLEMSANNKSGHMSAATGFTGGFSGMKRRMRQIVHFKSGGYRWSLLGVLLLLLLAVTTLTSPSPAASNGDLSRLKVELPDGWSMDRHQPTVYWLNHSGNGRGSITFVEDGDSFDLSTQLPNHSSVIADESLELPAGTARLITLDADNGSAASGRTGTHEVYYAAVEITGSGVYMLDFTRYDQSSATKDMFVDLLKSLHIQ